MSISELEITTEDVIGATGPTEDEATPHAFASLGLSAPLVSALDQHGYQTPTPIQKQAIPLLLAGRDVVGQAQTGTGKTAAFALPLIERLDASQRGPQILVLVPTRELAIQVSDAFKKYAEGSRRVSVLPVYGGQDYQVQLRPLKRGVQVVVGTPGRVMDHMRRGSLDLAELQCIVLDEADEMLRMGFAEDVDWVLTQAPTERQMALFSATMPAPIREIAQKHLHDPAQVTIHQKTAAADTLNQRYIVVAPRQKQATLARVLEAEPTDGVLVFVKTRSTTEPVAEFLAKQGWRTAALSGGVAQSQRERIVDRLRRGQVDVIVATDVAARGLDVDRISHVINYDMPHDEEAYIHRIGRTGRAGRSGQAILFLQPRDRRALQRLEQGTRQTIAPMDLPSNRAINKQRVARFHDKITDGLASKNLETFQSIIEQYQRENDVSLEMIAASLAMMANGQTPLLVHGDLKQASFADGKRRQSGNDHSRDSKRKREVRESRHPRVPNEEMQTFRIEVGKNHQVRAGNIVGAIANEAGIGSESIGRIKIFDRYSTVDLPQEMASELLVSLQRVSVSGRPLKISQLRDSRSHVKKAKRPRGK